MDHPKVQHNHRWVVKGGRTELSFYELLRRSIGSGAKLTTLCKLDGTENDRCSIVSSGNVDLIAHWFMHRCQALNFNWSAFCVAAHEKCIIFKFAFRVVVGRNSSDQICWTQYCMQLDDSSWTQYLSVSVNHSPLWFWELFQRAACFSWRF